MSLWDKDLGEGVGNASSMMEGGNLTSSFVSMSLYALEQISSASISGAPDIQMCSDAEAG